MVAGGGRNWVQPVGGPPPSVRALGRHAKKLLPGWMCVSGRARLDLEEGNLGSPLGPDTHYSTPGKRIHL